MAFNHSIKVPTQYRRAAKILKVAVDEKKSLKSLVFDEKHAKIPNLIGLLTKYINNKDGIESAIQTTNILVENPRFDPFLCRVLITEIIFAGKLLTSKSKPVQTVMAYKKRLEEALKSELKDFTSSTMKKNLKPRYIRINTHKFSVVAAIEYFSKESWRQRVYKVDDYDDYLKAINSLEEDEYLVDIHIPDLFVFHSKWKSYWAKHELVLEKKMLLQDKATCLVASLLNPEKESVILDMCAAPGMKTIHLSNIIENIGHIYAVEQDYERYKILCDMVQSADAKCVKPIKDDAIHLKSKDYPVIEYIVVDPSCSGSGMQNRLSLNDDKKDENRLWKLAGLQIKILQHAMTEFPNVKRIIYSTCSIYEEENEQVVQKCLERCPHFKLLNGKKSLGKLWKNTGNKCYKGIGKNCLYSLPNIDFTDGIFIAIFEQIKSN